MRVLDVNVTLRQVFPATDIMQSNGIAFKASGILAFLKLLYQFTSSRASFHLSNKLIAVHTLACRHDLKFSGIPDFRFHSQLTAFEPIIQSDLYVIPFYMLK